MENQQMRGLPRTPPPSSTIRRSSSSLRPYPSPLSPPPTPRPRS
ncbi:hypothetical protein CMEL01_14792 [Colletotrichum melonis]|uniref:Uncharacterized protein n=1 Tax=Colletotrichum melonis TaxID=1209925 RepID=A0AAI9UMN6_9PEZI|nr:hypothetical protein CMEL01_14792 [Colletotrichum melonis]